MHVGLFGKCLEVDVHGLAEAPRRQHWPSLARLPQELDEVLEGIARYRYFDDSGVHGAQLMH
jgi:hypothetical protein